jgi:hypothetical protein
VIWKNWGLARFTKFQKFVNHGLCLNHGTIVLQDIQPDQTQQTEYVERDQEILISSNIDVLDLIQPAFRLQE